MTSALCVLLSAMMAFTPATTDVMNAKMILIEAAQHGDMHRSSSFAAHGQCKRFQYDTFLEVAPQYMLSAYPRAALLMPPNHASTEESGRPVGTCWEMPDPAAGNAYVEVARFDYDNSLGRKENAQAAHAFLAHIRAGDMLQMLARYSSGGRGTHTLMFTRPYDPRLDTLYWADSNFANTRIDGVRYGYVRAYQAWPIDEVVGWLVADWNNGATLYRLNSDIVPRT